MKINFISLKWCQGLLGLLCTLCTIAASAQCVEPGESISFSNSGQVTTGHQTQFVLTDGSDMILRTVTSPFAAPFTEGNYKVYAVNFRTGQIDPVLTAGTNIKQAGGSCAAISASPLEFSVCLCMPAGSPLSFSTSGYNNAALYTSRYVVANSAGVIVSSSPTATFNAPTGSGEFSVYRLNWLTGQTDPVYSNGTSIGNVGGSCVARTASAVRFRVCNTYDFGNLPVSGPVTWPVAYASIPAMLNGMSPLAYDAASNPFFAAYAGTQVSTEAQTPASGADAGNDGLVLPLNVDVFGAPVNYVLTLNSNAAGRTVHYRLWFDWNNDGNFANDADFNNAAATYAGSAVVSGATNVTVPVLPPSATQKVYRLRMAVSGSAVADVYRDAGASSVLFLANGEVEDYLGSTLSTLPVRLNTFLATKQAKSSLLRWSSTFEENSSHFVVEKSVTGSDWLPIATVAAAGNSSVLREYSFTDEQPVQGNNYYRLRLVDRDGKSEYSSIRIVRFDQPLTARVYPNPASGFINVELPSGLTNPGFVLSDVAGRTVLSQSLKQAGSRKVELQKVLPGVYLVQVLDDGRVVLSEKLIIR